MGYKTTANGTQIVAGPERTLGQSRFLRIDDGSALMNVNGAPAGTPTVLWNGTGVDDTGGDWTAGGDGSETAAAMRTGTNGWDTGARSNGDASTFQTSDLDIQASYESLSFWINPQQKDAGTTLRLRWYHDSGTEGTIVIVDNYVDDFDIGVWQKVTIPLEDFALPGSQLVDELQIQFQGTPPSRQQQYYIDDIELNPAGAGGGPYIFQVAAPDAATKYHVSMLVLLLSGASTGWNSNTFANITALTNGLLLRQRNLTTQDILWSINSKDNTDLFGRYHPQDDITFADSTLLVGFMIKPGKASIIVSDEEALEFVVRDNLSGIGEARAFAHYGVEVVT